MFAGDSIRRLRIAIAADDIARLRRDSRQYVPATVREEADTFTRVGLHLKGSTGSFRSIDDKPALTLSFSRFVPGQRFHGLRKIHLNNSVEDPSYFNELAGSELFRAAGVPAPRVTHALVELNGRRLGLYVLKEGFSEEFLALHFRNTHGNLYDTGTGHDVDEALEKDQGEGPDDGSDLRALAATAGQPDLGKRWLELGRVLDLDRFLSFVAMEVITCHRDGYCLARNNFRVYHDVDTATMVFLPQGMDQLFGRPEATIHPTTPALVARAVLETPEGRRRYRERLSVLATNTLNVPALHAQAAAFLRRAQRALRTREARDLERALTDVGDRIAQRRRFLESQLREPEPSPIAFVNGGARVSDWRGYDAPAGGTLDRSPAPDGRPALHIRAGPRTSASWRGKALLAKGKYRFCTAVRTLAVEPLDFGRNQGAGLRVVGATPSPPYRLLGTHNWTQLEQPFATENEQEVELICELRACAGEAWFDLDSLRLEWVP